VFGVKFLIAFDGIYLQNIQQIIRLFSALIMLARCTHVSPMFVISFTQLAGPGADKRILVHLFAPFSPFDCHNVV